MKAEGRRVKILDDEPVLSFYELKVIKTASYCSGIQDIIAYGRELGIMDMEYFIDHVLYVYTRKMKDAKD